MLRTTLNLELSVKLKNAIHNNDIPVIKAFLAEHGAGEINALLHPECGEQGPALIYAVRENKMDILKLLINHPLIDFTSEDPNGNNILTYIASRGWINEWIKSILKLLLSVPRFDIKMQTSKGVTPLMILAGQRDTSKIMTFLELVDVNAVDAEGNTALHYAVNTNNRSVVDLLMFHALTNANIANKKKITPMLAAADKSYEMLVYFLGQMINVNATDENGSTALLLCLNTLKRNHARYRDRNVDSILKIIKKLVDKGVNLNHENNANETALSIVINCQDLITVGAKETIDLNRRIFDLLIASGADVNFIHGNGLTPLAFAIQAGRGPYFDCLLSKGGNVNHVISEDQPLIAWAIEKQPDSAGMAHSIFESPMFTLGQYSACTLAAACKKSVEMAKKYNSRPDYGKELSDKFMRFALDIIDHPTFDVNVNYDNPIKTTSLNIAIKYSCDDVAIKLLSKEGVKVNSCDFKGKISPIFGAICLKRESVVRVLLDHPAIDLNVRSSASHFTILMAAITFYSPPIFTRVLERCIHLINESDANKYSTLQIAACHKQAEVVAKLLELGVELNNVNNKNKGSALHSAVYYNCIEIVTLLLEAGIQVDLCDIYGTTARQMAMQKGFYDIAALIARYEKTKTYQERLEATSYRGGADREPYLSDFIDPLSGKLMDDPITVNGITFDRGSLIEYFKRHGNPPHLACPVTGRKISQSDLMAHTNVIMKKWIDSFVCRQEALEQARQAEIVSAADMLVSESASATIAPASSLDVAPDRSASVKMDDIQPRVAGALFGKPMTIPPYISPDNVIMKPVAHLRTVDNEERAGLLPSGKKIRTDDCDDVRDDREDDQLYLYATVAPSSSH